MGLCDGSDSIRDQYPSSYKRIVLKLFGIKALDVNTIAEPMPPCPLCELPITPDGSTPTPLDPSTPSNHYHEPSSPLVNTIMLLLCRHIIHATCIFKYWDSSYVYTHICPECHATATLNFDLCALPPLDYPNYPNATGRLGGNTSAHNTFAHHCAELLFVDPTRIDTRTRTQRQATLASQEFTKNFKWGLKHLPRNASLDISPLVGEGRQHAGRN